jgi:hypothetical protein
MMCVLDRIRFAFLERARRALEDERGEVLPWLGLTMVLVALVVAIGAAIHPAVLSDLSKIISEMGSA